MHHPAEVVGGPADGPADPPAGAWADTWAEPDGAPGPWSAPLAYGVPYPAAAPSPPTLSYLAGNPARPVPALPSPLPEIHAEKLKYFLKNSRFRRKIKRSQKTQLPNPANPYINANPT